MRFGSFTSSVPDGGVLPPSPSLSLFYTRIAQRTTRDLGSHRRIRKRNAMTAITAPNAEPRLDLPPPYRLVTLREAGDAFAHACADRAAKPGPAPSSMSGRFDVARVRLGARARGAARPGAPRLLRRHGGARRALVRAGAAGEAAGLRLAGHDPLRRRPASAAGGSAGRRIARGRAVPRLARVRGMLLRRRATASDPGRHPGSTSSPRKASSGRPRGHRRELCAASHARLRHLGRARLHAGRRRLSPRLPQPARATAGAHRRQRRLLDRARRDGLQRLPLLALSWRPPGSTRRRGLPRI